jgi:hypothetical protein
MIRVAKPEQHIIQLALRTVDIMYHIRGDINITKEKYF